MTVYILLDLMGIGMEDYIFNFNQLNFCLPILKWVVIWIYDGKIVTKKQYLDVLQEKHNLSDIKRFYLEFYNDY